MSLPSGSGAPRLPAIRLDPEPLDRGWRPPRRDDLGRSAGARLLVVTAVLMLVFGAIWIGGGLAERTDRVRSYAAGQQVDVGPYTLTLERVEIVFAQKSSYSDTDYDKWEVTAYGTATSKQEQPTPTVLDPALVMLANGRQFPGDLKFGASRQPSSLLEPGLSGVPVRLTAEIPGDWKPTGLVQIGVWEQHFGRHQTRMAEAGKTWGKSRTALLFWCPVTRMPNKT